MFSMLRKTRKLTVWLFILAMVAQAFGGAVFAAGASAENDPNPAVKADAQAALTGAAAQVLKGSVVSDWAVVALSRSGFTVPDAYLPSVEKQLKDEQGKLANITDYERLALGIRAAGGDPASIAGYNLIDLIVNSDNMTRQGANGIAYALLVLSNGQYKTAADAKWNEAGLIKWLLEQQNVDGGWSLVKGGNSGIDLTAMVLTSLSAYKAQDNVKSAIDRAVAWLQKKQLASGGFNENGEYSETSAQVVIALTSLGIDPAGAEFTKDGGTLLAHLLSYKQQDGSFSHAKGGASNAMATDQALQALAAYQLFVNGKGSLFAYVNKADVSVRVEGLDAPIAQGSAKGTVALDAVESFLKAKDIPFTEKQFSFGTILQSIGDEENGKLGGYDGWSFYIVRNGKTVSPDVGMGDFALQDGDEIVVYYGDGTYLISSVTLNPEQPKAGKPFEVKVAKSGWNNDTQQAETIPAAGVTVQINGVSKTTDDNGVAKFDAGVGENSSTLTVTGYVKEKAPTVARYVTTIHIVPAKVDIRVRIEGPSGLLAEGQVKAGNALEALKTILDAKQTKYTLKESAYGTYPSSIYGIGNGTFGGYDGWGYDVLRGGKWTFPGTAMADYELEDGDSLVVYYGDGTQKIDSVELMPAQPKAGEAFKLKVTTIQQNWDTGEAVLETSDAAGVTVQIGDQTVQTNVYGEAQFAPLTKTGPHTILVTGYQKDKAPKVLRFTKSFALTAPYTDESSFSDWAAASINEAQAYGIMAGVSTNGYVFAPKKSMTRAEFAALVINMLGIFPAKPASASFKDVSAKSWYYGYVEAAKAEGIVSGVSAGQFAPDRPVTRQEMAIMLSKAFHLASDGKTDAPALADLSEAAVGAAPYIQAVYVKGWMVGSSGKFHPKESITREMAATVAVKVWKSAK